jgi:hypothetical protein
MSHKRASDILATYGNFGLVHFNIIYKALMISIVL